MYNDKLSSIMKDNEDTEPSKLAKIAHFKKTRFHSAKIFFVQILMLHYLSKSRTHELLKI